MGGFAGLIQQGLKIIDTQTKSLQVEVQRYAWLGQDGFGDEDWDETPDLIKGVYEPKDEMRHDQDGRRVRVKGVLLIPRPVAPKGGTGRNEPIDYRDKIILPDGSTAPIIGNPTVMDPTTNRPFYHSVMLGEPSE